MESIKKIKDVMMEICEYLTLHEIINLYKALEEDIPIRNIEKYEDIDNEEYHMSVATCISCSANILD